MKSHSLISSEGIFYTGSSVFFYVVGFVLCSQVIEIKLRVSHFEMHFRDRSSFSSQCYISLKKYYQVM